MVTVCACGLLACNRAGFERTFPDEGDPERCDVSHFGAPCGVGACEGGTTECAADGRTIVCSTEAGGSEEFVSREVCDGVDNDCNGVADDVEEGCDCQTDADGDGQISQWCAGGTDCDDTPETGSSCWEGCSDYYLDTDGDLHGDAQQSLAACSQPSGYSPDGDDCAPLNAFHWSDCATCQDNDGDHYGTGCDLGTDCDDTTATGEACHTNCITFYADADQDSFGTASSERSACSPPIGYVANSDDCNDDDPLVSPDGEEGPSFGESCIDLLDNDCDGTWDASVSGCPAVVFRSVGPGQTAPIAVSAGSEAIDFIQDSVVLPSVVSAQVGIGDVLSYDSDGDEVEDSLAWVRRIAAVDRCDLADKDGYPVVPGLSTTSFWSFYRAYASLADAEEGNENAAAVLGDFDSWSGGKDLIAADQIWKIACYSGEDTTPVLFEGWTTDQQHYLEVFTPTGPGEVVASQRHTGTWDTTKYRLVVTDAAALTLNMGHLRVFGLQLHATTATSSSYATITNIREDNPQSVDLRIANNILRGANTPSATGGWHSGIQFYRVGRSGEIRIFNNIIYDFRASAPYPAGIDIDDADISFFVYNNTIYNATQGLIAWEGSTTAKNNLIFDCDNAVNDSSSFTAASTNNLCGPGTDSELPSAAVRNGVAVAFVDPQARDLRLAENDTGAKDAGVDVSDDADLSFDNDVTGARRTDGLWDIGAHEVQP